MLEENELSKRIIGHAIEVHKTLGVGLLESAYQECLYFDLLKTDYTLKSKSRCQLFTKTFDLSMDIELIC